MCARARVFFLYDLRTLNVLREEKEMKLNYVSIIKRNAKSELGGGAPICAAHNVQRYICHALNI